MFFGQYDTIPAEEEIDFGPEDIVEPDFEDDIPADQVLPEWLRDWEAAE